MSRVSMQIGISSVPTSGIAVFFLADAVFLGSPRAQREINDSVVGIAFGDGRSRGLGRADVGNVSAGIFYPSVQCGGPQRERAAEADDAVRAPGAYILAYEQVAGGQLAYSGDADEFRFEPGGVLPRAARPRFGDFVGQRRAGNGGARIARAPVGPVPGRTRVDDVFFRAPFFEPLRRSVRLRDRSSASLPARGRRPKRPPLRRPFPGSSPAMRVWNAPPDTWILSEGTSIH